MSELVANAARHGRGRIRMRLEIVDERLRVEVDDDAEMLGPSAPDSRGLQLVDALSCAWGVRLQTGGKTVWAELAL